MKKILVAYDGTPGAELALKEMTRGGFPARAEAEVLTIADAWLPPAPPDGVFADHPSYAATHAKAQEMLRAAGQTAILGARHLHEIFPDWTITNTAKADSPAWGIIAEARRWTADLIVIGSHGRTPLERFFLGSVSYKVAAEAACSVRISRAKRNHSERGVKILVALDHSSDAQIALDEVLNRSWRSGTEVHLVTVIDLKLKSTFLRKKTDAARVEDWIVPLHQKYKASFAEHHVTAHSHVFEGDPKSELLKHAAEWDVDCIFLGARGLEHGERLYLGTLASAVSTRAHCSVEIVRPKPIPK
jgi:nucleotide-binding universal stress UspA family protein